MRRMVECIALSVAVCALSAPVLADDIDSAAALAEIVVKTNFSENYSYCRNDNDLYFTIWADGVAEEISALLNGDISLTEAYNGMLTGIGSMAQSMSELFDSLELDGANVYLCVANDLNHDDILVVFEDGFLEWDVVNGYHLPMAR